MGPRCQPAISAAFRAGRILTLFLEQGRLRFLDRQEHKLCKPCHYMKPTAKALSGPGLAEIEREVVAQSRQWGRQRLEERLQALADE